MVTREELIELVSTDFSRYMHDQFLSTEQINTAANQTGAVTKDLFNFHLETGIQSASFAKMYYAVPWFNPKYSTLQFKLQMNSMKDVEMYIGFHEAVIDPSADSVDGDIRSHAGFFIINDVLYITTANEDNVKTIPLADIDLTNSWLLKIEYDKFYTRPLPVIYPYFDGLRTEKPTRAWSLAAQASQYPPYNKLHYVQCYIKNTTNVNKYIDIKHITYGERYAD